MRVSIFDAVEKKGAAVERPFRHPCDDQPIIMFRPRRYWSTVYDRVYHTTLGRFSMVDMSTAVGTTSVPKQVGAGDMSPRAFLRHTHHRSVLAPSWLSSNRAWKTARGRRLGWCTPSYTVVYKFPLEDVVGLKSRGCRKLKRGTSSSDVPVYSEHYSSIHCCIQQYAECTTPNY